MKKQLAAVKKQQKAMHQEFITKLGKARAELTAVQERDLVLRLAKNDVAAHLDGYVTAHRQQIIAVLENWWRQVRHPPKSDRSRTRRRYWQARRLPQGLGYE